jgi:hypothetical protein
MSGGWLGGGAATATPDGLRLWEGLYVERELHEVKCMCNMCACTCTCTCTCACHMCMCMLMRMSGPPVHFF